MKQIKDNIIILMKGVKLTQQGSKNNKSYYVLVPKNWITTGTISSEDLLDVTITKSKR